MRGTHSVKVQDRRRVTYSFDLRRNITVLRGDSGTGKTTLYEMVADHTRHGRDSAVSIACDKACVALLDMDWEGQLSRTRDSIVVVDEGARFVSSTTFSEAIQKTDNYYLIITRQRLHALPYSVDEIYEIESSGTRTHRFRRRYDHDRHLA